MVIDDSSIAREALSSVLRRAGFEVYVRDTPLGATATIARLGIDVVVLDINMPVMSGPRFARLIRSNPRLRDLRIVLVTGEAVDNPARIARELDASALVVKKDIDARLVHEVKQALGERSGMHEDPVEDGCFRLRSDGITILLQEGQLAIGRGEASLVVDDPAVSRVHAWVKLDAGEVSLIDAGSRNGTIVNGVEVRAEVPLAVGDVIEIGGESLVLQRCASSRSKCETEPPPA